MSVKLMEKKEETYWKKSTKYIVGIRFSEYDSIGEFDSLENADKFLDKNKALLESKHVINYWVAKVLFEG